MIILFGWKVRARGVGGGSFHCPVCQAPRAYDLVEARRWFTLFLLPVIPLRVQGRYVRCQVCQVTLAPGVLDGRTIEQVTFGRRS